jgi:hypothetical protein
MVRRKCRGKRTRKEWGKRSKKDEQDTKGRLIIVTLPSHSNS